VALLNYEEGFNLLIENIRYMIFFPKILFANDEKWKKQSTKSPSKHSIQNSLYNHDKLAEIWIFQRRVP
jgi:hypothetical protein